MSPAWIGYWVVAGTTAADLDHGQIINVHDNGVIVAWSSGVATRVGLADLEGDGAEVFSTQSAAVARRKELDAAQRAPK